MKRQVAFTAAFFIVCLAGLGCVAKTGAVKKTEAPQVGKTKAAVEKNVVQALTHYLKANNLAAEIRHTNTTVTLEVTEAGASKSAPGWQDKIQKLTAQKAEYDATIESLNKAVSVNKDPDYAEYCGLIDAIVKKDLEDNKIETQAAQIWFEICNEIAAAGAFDDAYYEKSKQAYALEASIKIEPLKYKELRAFADKNKLAGADILYELN